MRLLDSPLDAGARVAPSTAQLFTPRQRVSSPVSDRPALKEIPNEDEDDRPKGLPAQTYEEATFQALLQRREAQLVKRRVVTKGSVNKPATEGVAAATPLKRPASVVTSPGKTTAGVGVSPLKRPASAVASPEKAEHVETGKKGKTTAGVGARRVQTGEKVEYVPVTEIPYEPTEEASRKTFTKRWYNKTIRALDKAGYAMESPYHLSERKRIHVLAGAVWNANNA